MDMMLTANGVRFQDFLEFPAVEIEAGYATFISGDSGSGKTTLLRMFNATVPPTEGVITYNGTDIMEMNTIDLRRQVLLVSQTVYLFDETIRGNFEAYFEYRDKPLISDETIKQYLALCRAEFPLTARCSTLSGGERQRVFLAIHLAMQPRVLLLDEPTSALDQTTACRLLDGIKTHCAKEGITLVVVSHDPELSKSFADRVIRLNKKVSA